MCVKDYPRRKVPMVAAVPEIADVSVGSTPGQSSKEPERVRKEFPETWLWSDSVVTGYHSHIALCTKHGCAVQSAYSLSCQCFVPVLKNLLYACCTLFHVLRPLAWKGFGVCYNQHNYTYALVARLFSSASPCG